MCIAVYKPMKAEFPSKKTLKRCFDHNPDGAGYMVATGDSVIIHKGFMGFRSFWKSLRATRAEYGEDKAYVMHFRISTQGGVRKDGCHPFPLSSNMDELRKLDTVTDIGIAHNGIIDMCSTGWGKNIDYSDTMEFITEYLSLIIRDKTYRKDKNTLELIEKLCGSRLAILDKRGCCELIGRGWEIADGVWYSNDSYLERTYVPVTKMYNWDEWTDGTTSYKEYASTDDDLSAWKDLYETYYDYGNGGYDFIQGDCPVYYTDDTSYCDHCLFNKQCSLYE